MSETPNIRRRLNYPPTQSLPDSSPPPVPSPTTTPARKPFDISMVIRDTDDARMAVRRILREFPLACTDQADEASTIRDFKLDLDEDGRATHVG